MEVYNVPYLNLEIHQVHYKNNPIPTFHNLTELELSSLNYSWQFLVEVLNHCPKLQKLGIDQADVDEETWTRKDDKENWTDLKRLIFSYPRASTTCKLIIWQRFISKKLVDK
ncbi:hypothetical protein P8452_64522 [Trifolium repens]|nr:hypothetical protein P8452_64522 [Trifolium repens]